MTADAPDREPVGSAAEEAAKLLAALQDFARRTTGDHIATGAPECRLCPVCQLIAFVRDTRPETVEHLAGAGAALIAALRATLVGHQNNPPEAGTERTTGPVSGRPGVQHIDISDE
jgi:hypothetical protein